MKNKEQSPKFHIAIVIKLPLTTLVLVLSLQKNALLVDESQGPAEW